MMYVFQYHDYITNYIKRNGYVPGNGIIENVWAWLANVDINDYEFCGKYKITGSVLDQNRILIQEELRFRYSSDLAAFILWTPQ